jgi:DNA repair protein RadC
LTRRLIEVGHLMGIALEDHVIIAGYDHLSLRMQGGVSGW